ncbi:MAG: BamA/TamA family outer membrane protein [Ignavibacteriales bacterium]|nr:BamA/TamA family outer membrane protein [Ignavibacteriales bacterium]
MLLKNNVLIFVSLTSLFWDVHANAQTDSLSQRASEWEVFPIINYDSDAGFGYGGKGFLYNLLGGKESFDLTLYNSTKGERWYRFVFSSPDIQRRQGTKYPIAFDLTFDYDKWISYKFYSAYYNYQTGTQTNGSENYIREPIELTALLSRGFAKDFVAEFGARFKSISCYNFDSTGSLQYRFPTDVKYVSFIFNFRWDTRTNFINPLNGFVLEIDNEYAPNLLKQGNTFYKVGILSQFYLTLFKPNYAWANRIILQTISDVNYQLQLPLGGNNTVRGLPQDRYLSNSTVLINSEFRFPIWRRFGGIAGVDIGNSESTPDWVINPVIGLRFYMDNFIVRFDVGFGEETTGIYFNFGHIF